MNISELAKLQNETLDYCLVNKLCMFTVYTWLKMILSKSCKHHRRVTVLSHVSHCCTLIASQIPAGEYSEEETADH